MKDREMSSRASSLLRKSSAGFEPSFADKTKTRAAIARRVGVGLAAGAAVAVAAKSAAAKSAAAAPSLAPSLTPAVMGVSFATKLVAAVAIVGTVSAGAVTVNHVTREANRARTTQSTTITIVHAPVAPTQAASTAGPDVQQTAVPPSEVQYTASPVATNAERVALAAAPLAASPIVDPSQKSAKTASALQIGAELELINRAQQALQAEDANEALALLNEHARRFPNGALAEERDAARVLALCGAGRQEDAATAGAAFLSAHPDSPLATRVRSSCANGINTSE